MSECLDALERYGLLLKSDTRLPSVTTIVAGEPVRGSWWAHPASHAIFHELETLGRNPDVLLVKLIAGKDTLVHRRLWPHLLTIVTAREPWQFRDLSPEAQRLYDDVLAAGSIEISGQIALDLEVRLVVRAEQFHSVTGEHRKRLEDWVRWAARTQTGASGGGLPAAKQTIEPIFSGARFPWQRHAPTPPAGRESRYDRNP
jgi:hypothetical protein